MNKTRGITLISLVVTIIVLIIIAGITINLILGDNGILKKSQFAKEDYLNAQSLEGQDLNELYAYITRDDLPQNSPENPQDVGTIVKLPDEWQVEAVKYIKTSDGTEATELTKVATVYAVSVGNGETVPVPGNGVDKGFYYVGGNLNTGVIISDNSDDRYGYNPETKQNDTTLDKTTYEYTTKLKGNQFVWIPCSTSEYHKTNIWNGKEQQNAYWDTTTPKSELTQIEKYDGFYVARYEAGLASTIAEFKENQIHTGSNQIYNLDGVPQSKAGVVPWMFIDWEHAKTNAESMYNNNYVSSGLITGTQWDVILNKMVSKNVITANDLTNSSAWGNYRNNKISYTGRLARADNGTTNSGKWTLKPFGSLTSGTTSSYSSNNGDLLTTGVSRETEKYHIFDLAGSLWEWTEEDSRYRNTDLDKTDQDGTQYRVSRGGSYGNTSSGSPACYRNGTGTVSWTSYSIGFRAVLYIK